MSELMHKRKIDWQDRLNYLLLVLILGFAAYQCYGMLKPGHDWGGDFALYVNQTIHISEGKLDELYAANKIFMEESQYEIGPFLYPNGFPILLLPVYWLFGLDLLKMKVLCILFFLGSLVLVYLLLKKHFEKYRFIPVIIVGLIAVNYHYIGFTDNVLSEFPFLFFSLLFFYTLQKKVSLTQSFATGFVLFYAYFIRDIGICLVPALLVCQAINWKQYSHNKKIAIIPIAVFATLFILSKLVFPNGGANHTDMLLQSLTWEQFDLNVKYYTEILSSVFVIDQYAQHVGNKVLMIMLVGVILSFKKNAHFFVYLLGYFAIIIFWPSQQNYRFLLPVLPIIVLFVAIAVFRTAKLIHMHPVLLYAIILYLIYPYAKRSIKGTNDIKNWHYNEAQTPDMQIIYDYLKKNIAENKIVSFEKPRVLYLFTGVQSIYTDPEHFYNSKADYFLLSKNQAGPKENITLNIVQEFTHYYLMKR